jgi:hypothetical protein
MDIVTYLWGLWEQESERKGWRIIMAFNKISLSIQLKLGVITS